MSPVDINKPIRVNFASSRVAMSTLCMLDFALIMLDRNFLSKREKIYGPITTRAD